ncbi:hypothetical protein KEM55_000195 [Ascosphaera atra]|nr:hypothetical protein KEM55_000195 [Ascosphaera atra]
MSTTTPEVTWAQRSNPSDPAKNIIFITILAPDVPPSDLKLDITPTAVSFKGKNVKDINYAVDLELYAEIDPEESKKHHNARGVSLVLRKKEAKEEYWPRLLKEARKVHFLKTDFDKWVDEDEQNEAPEDEFSGYPDMAGMGDEGLDFSKLGGGGMGDLGNDMDMAKMQEMLAQSQGGNEAEDSSTSSEGVEEEKEEKKKIEEVA